MDMNFSLIKQHPYMSAAFVGALVLLIYVVTKKGNSGAAGSAVVLSGTGQSDAAAAAAATQQQGNTVASQTQLGLGALSLQANANNNATQLAITQLASQVQLAQTTGAVTVAQTTSDNNAKTAQLGLNDNVQALQIQVGGATAQTQIAADSQTHLVDSLTRLISGIGAPTTVGQFDPFNTAKASQPILQGYDATIAQELDTGSVKVGAGGMVTISGDSNSPGGTYVAMSPLDARWAHYVPGTYSKTGAINFAA
jgi:hypothetical protein